MPDPAVGSVCLVDEAEALRGRLNLPQSSHRERRSERPHTTVLISLNKLLQH